MSASNLQALMVLGDLLCYRHAGHLDAQAREGGTDQRGAGKCGQEGQLQWWYGVQSTLGGNQGRILCAVAGADVYGIALPSTDVWRLTWAPVHEAHHEEGYAGM
eukprot:1147004-Pelagomonas_calceolata.AAC.8